jgi:hypothetical protein
MSRPRPEGVARKIKIEKRKVEISKIEKSKIATFDFSQKEKEKARNQASL